MGRSLLHLRARLACAWEAAPRAILAIWAAMGLVVVMAGLGLLEKWGDPWRAAIMLTASGAFCFGLVAVIRQYFMCDRDRQDSRIAADSRVSVSRLRLSDTTLANANPQAQALFEEHRRRELSTPTHLHVRRPRAALAAADPLALRWVLLAAMVVAFLMAGNQFSSRFTGAFTPHWIAALHEPDAVRVWLVPPAYLPLTTTALDIENTAVAEIAEGGSIRVQVADPRDLERIRIGQERLTVDPTSPLIGSTVVKQGLIARFGARRLPVQVLPDVSPSPSFVNGVTITEDRTLQIDYLISDDHGATALALRVRASDGGRDQPGDVDITITPGKTVRGQTTLDLTDHSLAGRAAELRLVARDAAGQEGISAPVSVTLPQAILTQPLARALAHERAILSMAGGRDPSEEVARDPGVRRVRDSLGLMQLEPALFDQDPVVHMALAYAETLLADARAWPQVDRVGPVLWDAAIRAEGGELATAERALQEAERQLNKALALGEEPAEILRLTQNYQRAAQRYMELLMAEALLENRVEDAPAGGGGGGDVSEDQLAEMLRTLDELIETGAYDEARQLLALITELLNNMEVTLQRGGSGGEGEDETPWSEALDAIDELIGEQRALQQQTLQDQREGAASGAEAQADLAGRTGDLMVPREGENGLGIDTGEDSDSPGAAAQAGEEALDRAAQAMEDAASALRQGNAFRAATAQNEALQALREAAGALSEADQQARNAGREPGEDGTDPLGRELGGGAMADGEDVNVPDASQRTRARAILDALRDALADRELSEDERAYLQRLLEQF